MYNKFKEVNTFLCTLKIAKKKTFSLLKRSFAFFRISRTMVVLVKRISTYCGWPKGSMRLESDIYVHRNQCIFSMGHEKGGAHCGF